MNAPGNTPSVFSSPSTIMPRPSSRRHYHGAYFLFAWESDRAYYQKLFDSTEWPEYKVNRQTGKIFRLYETFQPDTVTNLRTCFRFIHEPADPTAP